jgi:opacity protein-like surface antigen
MPLSRPLVLLVASLALLIASIASAQSEPAYVRKNSFGMLFAYSNDSDHILFGQAEQRKLLNIGVSYSRKLIAGRIVNFQYDAEFLPVALESDPLTRVVTTYTSPKEITYVSDGQPPSVKCDPFTAPIDYTINGVVYEGTLTASCHGRQWTMGTAMSPAGLQWNFLPQHRLQPFLTSHGGYMFSSSEIPIGGAGAFNFTVDAGGGLEYFRSHGQSIRAQWRYHHTSNHDTASSNPGIDNGVFQVSYLFGR